tara:strand:- start:78 stop:905 length:828 start_codon:yes stop_codon:yes gene_type:complete
MAIRRSDRVSKGGTVKKRRMSSSVPIRANSKSFETSIGMTPDGPALFVSAGGTTRAVTLNLDEVETRATGGISVKTLTVDNEELTTTMSDVSDFTGSGTFSATGTYASLRAQATTASDVDLGSVINAAQLQKANNLSDLDTVATARTNLGIGASDTVSIQSLTASDTLSVAQKLLLTGSEELANGAAASQVEPISYFTTGGAETATLAVGTDGQVKIFSMIGDSGDMVITVSNAGWKSSGTGTLTFDTIGDSCTLIYESSAARWMLIGNNGVVAA